jgi:cysteine desulfurase / selenocysteine lyase
MKDVRLDFPLLRTHQDLIYLDSAATSLKPQIVLDAMNRYYTDYGANIHRGLYAISEEASSEYEETRQVVADFINAPSSQEIIFTRNATESVNLITYALGREMVDPGDQIVTTVIEHHANFVPWQQLAFQHDAEFKVIDCLENGDLDIYDETGRIDLSGIITTKTRFCALTLVSNVLGTVQPVKEIIKAIRAINPKTLILVDAAQAVPHMPVDVQDLDCDFLALSSHKMCGPTGVGVLWGRNEILAHMPPFLFGGAMIREVRIEETTYDESPHRFEAGTPDIAGVIGLKAAVRYLQGVGMQTLYKHEQELGATLLKQLQEAFGTKIRILGADSRLPRIGLAAFELEGCHPHDVAALLDEENIAVRAGNHCAMPLHARLKANATTRASLYLYTTHDDITKLVTALHKVHTRLCPSIKK